MHRWHRIRLATALLSLIAVLAGCGKAKINQALESDANGFICRDCSAKFYTEREVFPDRCPQCKQPNLDQVIGFVCTADNYTTLGPRARGSRKCEKCGAATTAISIPRESELKAWGAAKKTKAEVCGN